MSPPSPARALLLAALFVLGAAGCGNERTPPPDAGRPESPVGFHTVTLKRDGLRFRSPLNWQLTQGLAPAVATLSSGRATVAFWRYPRSEPLPTSEVDFADAVPKLVRAARRRDATLRLDRPRVRTVAGVPAIVLTGEQAILGRRRRVRSVHFFAGRSEVVVDAFAPPREFARVDREVFRPLVRSLRISTRRAT